MSTFRSRIRSLFGRRGADAASNAGGAGGRAGEDNRYSDRPAPHAENIIGPLSSLLVHIVFLLIAALLVIRPGGGEGVGEGADIDFAVLSTEELADLPQSPFEAIESPLDSVLNEDSAAVEASFEADVAAAEVEFADAGSLEILGGAGDGVDTTGLTGGSMGGGTSFFGIESRGQRFMYIVDVSGSMSTENRMSILQRNLINSIEELPQHTQFYVIAYNTHDRPMTASNKWHRAGASEKRTVVTWIKSLDAEHGTHPTSSFERAFKFEPRPDVIYFMTDGQNIEGLATTIKTLNNRGRRTRINTIAFGDQSSETMMQKIARDSGGKYRFVPSR